MTYSIIQKSQLEGALRIDAEYYQPEYLELVDNLKKLKAVLIKEIVVSSKKKFKPKKNELFHYIEISEIDLSTGEYNEREILGEDAPDRAQWLVSPNDIIISTVRPIRSAVSLIKEKTKNLVCSSGFAVLRAKNIEQEYLFVYLKSLPIVKLLNRQTTATMYPAITVKDILNTKIYLGNKIFREEIKNKVIESQQKIEKSKFLYQKAEELLLEELGLKDFQTKDDLSYIVNFSDMISANRSDAEYFQPKYDEIVNMINKNKNTSFVYNEFGQNKKILKKEKERYNYIEISDVNISNGEIISNEVLKENLPANAKIFLDKDDLLVSKVRPYRGAVGIIDFEKDDLIGSGAFAVLTEKKNYKKEVLMVLLRADLYKTLIMRYNIGTSYPVIKDEDILNLRIPILPKQTQQKIANLVRESRAARQKAKQLLEQAKQKVENLIQIG